MQGLKVEQLDGYLWVTATRVGDKLRLDYRVDDARGDGRDFYDGDDDLSDWTDDQIRQLACDMLSIDRNGTCWFFSMPFLIASRTRGVVWPRMSLSSTITLSPKNSARPSLTHMGRSSPKRLKAN